MFKHKVVSLSVWYKTASLLLLVLFATSIYDKYYQYNNQYIKEVEKRISSHHKDGDKPLVVVIGASLEMLATHRDWFNDDFDWLRVIIQGSRIDDYYPVIDEIVAKKPDLVIIGLHLFIDKSIDQHLRDAFKRLLRAPLESAGLIQNRLIKYEINNCTGAISSVEEVLSHMRDQFNTPKNELYSRIVKILRQRNIPLVILKTPMLSNIELEAESRLLWIDNFVSDAEKLKIEVWQTNWILDRTYFCLDKQHANKKLQKELSDWLKPMITASLENLL